MRVLAFGCLVFALLVVREVLRLANEARRTEPGRERRADPDLPPTHTKH